MYKSFLFRFLHFPPYVMIACTVYPAIMQHISYDIVVGICIKRFVDI
jgi:hypothetical protein